MLHTRNPSKGGKLRPALIPLALLIALPAAAEFNPVAAASAQEAPAPQAAGLRLKILSADKWPGPAKITRELTPVKVRIENGGSDSVLVSYNRFRMVGADGRQYRALPLYKVEGTAEKPTIRDPFEIREPKFAHSGFALAPFYSRVYRGVPVADGFIADPVYYDLYDGYYSGKPLPTTGMRRRAVPEGVLSPGGHVEGFLYFEEIPRSADNLALRYSPINLRTRTAMAEIQALYDD